MNLNKAYIAVSTIFVVLFLGLFSYWHNVRTVNEPKYELAKKFVASCEVACYPNRSRTQNADYYSSGKCWCDLTSEYREPLK